MNALGYICRCRSAALLLVAVAGCPSPAVTPDPLKTYKDEAASQPAAAGAEQELAFWKGRDDLIANPGAQPAQALKLPPLRRFKLGNGLRVLVLPDQQLPLVSVRLLLQAGAIDEPATKVGLAEFTASMLRQGTTRMTADVLSRTVDSAGAGVSANSDYELTSVSCSGRKQSTKLCLQLVADLVQRPTFPKKEMGEIRDRLMSAIKQMRDDPDSLASAHLDNLLYGDDHPAGRPMTEASLQRISREDLLAFHKRRYVPGAAILAISGDVNPAKLERLLRGTFNRWRGRPAPARTITPVKDPPAGLKVLLVDKPDLSQSFLALGHAGIRRTHPDRDAVRVMNYVLGGGGFSSRLMETVRAKGGKTYGISSAFDAATDDGSFSVASFTKNDQIVQLIELVRDELKRLHSSPPTAAEITAAKGKIAGGFPIRLKTAAALAAELTRAQLRGLPDSYVVEFPLRVDRQSAQQIAAAARAHVRPGHLIAAVVGKAAEVAPLLRRAKIPFEQVSYLDPISARDRRQLTTELKVTITPAEAKIARAALTRALRAAGGRARLAKIKTLRLQGTVGVGAPGNIQRGRYTALYALPDHMRLLLEIPPIGYAQVLAGDKAFIQVGPQRKDLPGHVVQRMKAVLWRDPILLPLHALGEGVRARRSIDAALKQKKGWLAIELFPPAGGALTMVLDRKTHHLLQIRHRNRQGRTLVTEMGGHKKVSGVMVPHTITAVIGAKRQSVNFKQVEINPRLSKSEIVGPAATGKGGKGSKGK
jgi:zinc protease